MRTLLLASAAVLMSLPAFAGSLTIGLASTPLTGSKTYTLTDADAAKLIAYVQAAYPTRANPAYDPACTTACAPAILSNTAAQSLSAWADGIVAGTIANVKNYQQGIAAKTATDGVTPIDIH